jgi:MazG family protein
VFAHDDRFHRTIIQSTGNPNVIHAYEQSHCHLHLFRLYHLNTDWKVAVGEHREIHRAIAVADADQAEASMRTHLHNSYERFVTRLIKNRQGHENLADIPLGLPALTRAAKLQKRAARHGFDWPDIHGVMEKLNEEALELNEAIAGGAVDAIEEELGDVLFTVVNLCRHLKVDAETALRRSSVKFEQRINHIEDRLHHQGKKMVDTPTEQLDDLWTEAKYSEVSKHL